MTEASADGPRWRHLSRIGRLACGVAAVIASMAAVLAVCFVYALERGRPTDQQLSLGEYVWAAVWAAHANPDLPGRCGMSVVLVLDESASIPAAGATAVVRSAAREFVERLSGSIDWLVHTVGESQLPGTPVEVS